MEIKRPIIIILITVATLLLIFLLVSPKYKEFKDSQIKLSALETEYNSKYAYFAEITDIYNKLQLRKESLAKVDDALPATPKFSNLVYFTQKKASENGLVIKDLVFTKVSSPASGSKVREIVFSVNLLGSYDSLKSFIRALEKSSNLIEITSISFGSQSSIAASPSSTTSSVYQFSLDLKTHSY